MSYAIALNINTLSFAKKLKAAGVNDKQAEAQAEALNDVLNDFQEKRLNELATKGDLLAVKTEIKAEIGNVKAGLRTEIKSKELRLIKWGITLMFAQLAGIAAIIKLFLQ
jgi:hypothetical protein